MGKNKNASNKGVASISKLIDAISTIIGAVTVFVTRTVKMLDNPVATGVLGLLIGLSISHSFLVRPLQVRMDKREEALQEWDRINRIERETVATLKTLSTEEMRKWMATLDKQNVQFVKLQSLLHKRDRDFTKPDKTYVVVCFLAFALAVGCVCWVMSDSNAQALQTMDNALLLLPALRNSLRAKEGLTVDVVKEYGSLRSPEKSVAAIEDQQIKNGKIDRLRPGNKSAYIKADQGGEELFVHVNEVVNLKNRKLQSGMRVAFSLGKDRQGRACAQNVEILD